MIKNPDGTITLTAEEYEELESDQAFLFCLQAAGVDSWHGYEIAQDDYSEQRGE